MKKTRFLASLLFLALLLPTAGFGEDWPCYSGIYPHLANFNTEGECGTGAVVPWAGYLWNVSYGPHSPYGSSDRLRRIAPDLSTELSPVKHGGTHANRMIHPESQQLFIGCYVIDRDANVRLIPSKVMPGRLTGCARHLEDPENRIYIATMEEGFYDVDVHTLDVTCLYPDSNRKPEGYVDILPGYHGKGFYSGQGRLVYANNGEQSSAAMYNPETPSGCLAQWADGKWEVVLRNQFTEVTGPGGIYGNPNVNDPLWSVGWDFRSVIFMTLCDGEWTRFRLPKASHCYDGAHGWNTEWPRIREINDPDTFLMTMHGTFWRFPKAFSASNPVGIRPRSTYLKVIGDFCFWNGRVVCGCDDTAKSEFLNKSPFKGELAGPGQSNSNLWFVEPDTLDQLGPALGRGAVWLKDPVKAGAPSDAYLFAGYDRRGAFLVAEAEPETDPASAPVPALSAVTFTFEVWDGNPEHPWETLQTAQATCVTSDRGPVVWVPFPKDAAGEWIRVKADRDLACATCYFFYQNADGRLPAQDAAPALLDGVAQADSRDYTGALLWVRPDTQTLAVVAQTVKDDQLAEERLYELTADMRLVPVEAPEPEPAAEPQPAAEPVPGAKPAPLPLTLSGIRERVRVPELPANVYTVDDASVICTYHGKRFRLPFGAEALVRTESALPLRLDREVATERDLFHCAGTFYELPAENAGGLPKVRPIATDGRRVTDYASYRGLMVLSGIEQSALADTQRNAGHIIRSADGRAALWVGAIDDLWAFGKPVGHGWLWKNADVKADDVSLPMLMNGFDRKTLRLTNHGQTEARLTIELDITGTGEWRPLTTLVLAPGQELEQDFSDFQTYWFRVRTSTGGRLSAEITYR